MTKNLLIISSDINIILNAKNKEYILDINIGFRSYKFPIQAKQYYNSKYIVLDIIDSSKYYSKNDVKIDLEKRFKSCVRESRRKLYIRKRFLKHKGVSGKSIQNNINEFVSRIITHLRE